MKPRATRGSNTTGQRQVGIFFAPEPLDRALAGAFADLGRVAQIGGKDRARKIVVALHAGPRAADHAGADPVARARIGAGKAVRGGERDARAAPAGFGTFGIGDARRPRAPPPRRRARARSGPRRAGSSGSSMSRLGQSWAISAGSARPQTGLRARCAPSPPRARPARRASSASGRSTTRRLLPADEAPAARDPGPPSVRASRSCRAAGHATARCPRTAPHRRHRRRPRRARAIRSCSRSMSLPRPADLPCSILSWSDAVQDLSV